MTEKAKSHQFTLTATYRVEVEPEDSREAALKILKDHLRLMRLGPASGSQGRSSVVEGDGSYSSKEIFKGKDVIE